MLLHYYGCTLGVSMRKRIQFLLYFILILAFLLVTGCNKSIPTSVLQEQAAFDEYLNVIFRDIASSDTLTLNYTILNPSSYDIQKPQPTLGQFTIEAMQTNYEKECSYLGRLTDFTYENLTKDQQLCYDMVKESFLLDCKYSDYTLYNEVLGPTTGLQAQLPILLAEYNLNSKSDIEDYLALLQDIPRYFQQICDFETIKSKAGLFMSNDVANEIIKQCTAFIDQPDSNYLIEYFNEKMDAFPSLSASERQIYKDLNEEYVKQCVIPAYENLIDSLKNLLGTGTNSQGLYYYKNGKSYYEYLVASETGSSRPISELAAMLEDTLNTVLLDMETYIKNDPDAVQKLSSYHYIKTEPEEILDYLKKAVTKDFPSLPNVNCTIKYVHKSLQEYVSPAMYLIPQLDNYSENSIYINTNPNYDMSELFTTIAHEGYPGHLYQCVYFRNQDIHPIRNVLTNLGYEEGWATYAEMYSYSIAGLDPSVAAILRDNMIATHCIYSRTDIGIHYEGWTYQQVQDYLTQYISPKACEIIYKTLLEEPGLYLPYSVGYLEIMELRKTAEETLGKKFNLKEFHTFLLDLGPVSFDLINNRMKDWLKEQN